ncbi:Permease of the drug/metabolite transporter (DMT) superfamily [Oceanospirillum multiglobuliferum]|nr:DMT family transporter [Oceanospirillum multiglobuliferum]SKA28946.1 Permease of the drug/metabolite transporter (DMT) superfamily [Oceanospirillum multiglobuliferum]
MQQMIINRLAAPTTLRFVPWVFVLLWSTGFISAKYGLPYSDPFSFLSLRMLGNLMVFALLLKIFSVTLPKRWALWKQQIITGSLVHTAYLGGVFSAIEQGASAGLTALLVGLQPILTAVLMAIVYKNAPSFKQWLGLALGITGVALVLTQGRSDILQSSTLGMAQLGWILLALLGITLGTLYQKNYCEPQPLLGATFIQYLAGLVVMLPLIWWRSEGAVDWHPQFVGALVWSILVLSVGAILLLMLMIQAGEATKTASYFYLVPPLTALEAWLLFDEQLSWVSLCGMVLTVTGVYWVNRK